MTERSARWIRVSTGTQDEASQVPDIDKHVAANGYVPSGIDYVVHAKSAYHGKQDKDLDRAIADIEAGRFDVLVCWVSDRIERRGAAKLFELMARAKQAGGRIEFAREPHLNEASNELSDVMLALAATMARQESRRKSERVVIKHDSLRAKNSLTGTVPWGYERVELDGVKSMRLTATGRKWLPVIFEMVASGDSLGKVARFLMASRVPTSSRGNGTTWYPRTVSEVIRNSTYAGQHRNGQGHVLEVEAAVSDELFQDASDNLDARPKHGVPLAA
jgi:DNA invertase Pin-like site-specific DNA recombinase